MTPSTPRRRLLAALAAGLVLPAARSATAAPADGGPLTLVVPFSAGGQFDSIARQFAGPFGAAMGANVIVENVGGAGGNIAAARVARARPDGQTLLMYGGNHAVARALFKKLDYDPVADFAPVSRLTIAPHVVMASLRSGIDGFAALQRRARDGAPLAYGSPGIGTSMHLTFEILKDHFGLDVVHVPYRGGANVMTDLVGGQVDLGIIAVGPALEFIRSGKVVALAVTSRSRSATLPAVPAVAELGMPGFDAGSWAGLAVPSGTPAATVARLNAAAAAALRAPALRKLFDEQAFVATPGTPDEMRRFVEQEAQRYAPIIRKLNLAA